jgi:hypothetical protein
MHLSGHTDPHVYARYVMHTVAMRTIPAASLPNSPFGVSRVANFGGP